MSERFVESAFPSSSDILGHNAGITMRDYFAAKAMQGMLQGELLSAIKGAAQARGVSGESAIAIAAYELADLMLAERAK